MRREPDRGSGARRAAAAGGLLVAGAVAWASGCTQTPPKPVGGLELIIAADGLSAPADFDDIHLEVSQQSDGGNWNKLWGNDYEVPSPAATLPATFAIIAGQSPDQEVLIEVTAFKVGEPVVQRVAQVQVPTDRVAALWMVLAEVCRGQVAVVGAEGEVMSTCPSGQSCQPRTGACGSNVISEPGALPTYVPGERLDAAPEAIVVAVTAETGPPAAAPTADLGRDAAEAGSSGSSSGSGGSGDSGPDAAEAGPLGSGSGSGGNSDSGRDAAEEGPSNTLEGGAATPLSCTPGGPGTTNCGPGGSGMESCCNSLEVPGGTFYRSYDILVVDASFDIIQTAPDGGPTDEADPATVRGFRLDKYPVTVGRFRQFVSVWNNGDGYVPPAGSGKHTHLNEGNGLNATGGGYEPGWVATDDINIAPTDRNLVCASGPAGTIGSGTAYATWTNTAGSRENLPINCVNWWEAYAFCIWDGGFLPSQAEREYAATGGGQQRFYPWGSTDPGTGNQYAIYGGSDLNCYYPSGTLAPCTGVANIAPVGTPALGAGLWGQLDLAGEVSEWTMDSYGTYVNPCMDCAYLTADSSRVIAGGYWGYGAGGIAPFIRNGVGPEGRDSGVGLRCARTP